MSALPVLSWREVIKALSKAGFQTSRQKGSHIVLRRNEIIVVVPKHDQIKRGTLMEIMAQAELTREEFLALI
ncbi:MAG: type II toxin-antitoxin system HicA family toxin [Nitrososphaeria archaeon]